MLSALVVDDNSDSRYLLECILTANGFQVISAANGREALEQTELALPDLVLSDILMPVMDGFTLCRQWKQSPRLKSIPFVFYTATYTDAKDEQLALSLGADLFVVKPTEPDELVRLVQQVLSKKASGQLRASSPENSEETPFLRQYNEVLVRKLEAKLLELEHAHQRLLVKDFAIASAPTGIAMTDLAGRVNYVNASFSRMWRGDEHKLLGQPLDFLFSNAQQLSQVLAQVQQTRHWAGQLNRTAPERGPEVAHTEIHLVPDAHNTPLCLMIVCSDITEQERMRRELQRMQRMEALSQFAAGIAHDFNNLLTAIFASLDITDAPEPRAPIARDNQAIILSAFECAKDLTRRLLNFGKGGAMPKRAVGVRSIIEECCTLALSGSLTQWQLDVPEGLTPVHASGTELSQVLCNIIINARQAMQDAGKLQINARDCTVSATDNTQLAPGDYVRIELRDFGRGMNDAVLARIFEPFFTTKSEGTGLGLAMCHAIISEHGGRISVNSSPGAGATFTIWLPASSDGVASVRKTLPASKPGTGRILVLDDNDQVREITSRLLQKQGYQVTAVDTGERAIEEFEGARGKGQPIDLLILDLNIRGGLGGEQTLARLRLTHPEVVALACTGSTDTFTTERLKAAGFVGVLGKPFFAHELYSTVQAAIDARPQ